MNDETWVQARDGDTCPTFVKSRTTTQMTKTDVVLIYAQQKNYISVYLIYSIN